MAVAGIEQTTTNPNSNSTAANGTGRLKASARPPDVGVAEKERARRLDMNRGKRCFVIMPFGEKKHPFTEEMIDFDKVYTNIIARALGDVLQDYERSDSATSAGLIHSEMIDDIISCDVAVVDITMANPNVMYELGVRHAAKRTGTVVIKRQNDRIPFNIGGIRAFEYPDTDDPEEIESFVGLLKASVQSALDGEHVDSLVHGLFRGLNVTRRARVLPRRETHVYRWPSERDTDNAREICIVTGDLADISGIDVWVNPENTGMQMGRLYDDSVSATIRYYGARRDRNGFVVRDTVADALNRAKARAPVAEPGTVFETKSGALRKSNRVKKILHLAAQYGEPSKGYVTVRNTAGCVRNCLRAVDHMNNRMISRLFNRIDYDSVLLPLFGTRNPDRVPEQCARDIVEAALLYFEKYPDSLIQRVYFAAYTDVDYALCEQAFKWAALVKVGIEPKRRLRHRYRRRSIRNRMKSETGEGHEPVAQA